MAAVKQQPVSAEVQAKIKATNELRARNSLSAEALGVFVNAKDQSFLTTVFKHILEGRWSINSAKIACKNKAMRIKVNAAVKFNLNDFVLDKSKAQASKALPATMVQDPVANISGCRSTFAKLQMVIHVCCCQVGEEIFE